MGEPKMVVKFDVKMTEQSMYDFMMYHSRTHVSGIAGAAVGVVSLGLGIFSVVRGDYMFSCLFFVFAAIFLVFPPFSMRTKAREQIRASRRFDKPVSYELTNEGVSAKQDGKTEQHSWDSFIQVVVTKKLVLLYKNKRSALIFPVEDLGKKYKNAVKMITDHMPPEKQKIRNEG